MDLGTFDGVSLTPCFGVRCWLAGARCIPNAYRNARTEFGRVLISSTPGEAVTFHSRFEDLAAPPPLTPTPRSRPRAAAGGQSSSAIQSRFAHYLARPILRLGPSLFAIVVVAVLTTAWWLREEGHLSAETGAGYWLGIIGAVFMLMLVGYPLRKRLRAFQSIGRVANWFRFHMIIGILGPALGVAAYQL